MLLISEVTVSSLRLVVNNKQIQSQAKAEEKRILLAKGHLARASLILSELGGEHQAISSLIDECTEMLNHKDSDTFANSDEAISNEVLLDVLP